MNNLKRRKQRRPAAAEEESVVSSGNHCKQSQTCSNGAKEGTESKTRNRREGRRRSDDGDSFPESQIDGPTSRAVHQPTRRRREVIYVPPRKKQGSPGVIPKKRRQLLPILEEASPERTRDPAELEEATNISEVTLQQKHSQMDPTRLRVAASPQKDDIVSTADPCLSTEPMEFGGALKASAPEKAKTLDPGATSSDSTKPQETCMPITKCLEESPLPLPLTPQEEKETPLSIDTTLIPRCAPSSSLVADSKTKDVTKSTTTSAEANGAEDDDGADVAAGASDPHSGNFGRNPCPASAGAAEKDTGEDDNATKPSTAEADVAEDHHKVEVAVQTEDRSGIECVEGDHYVSSASKVGENVKEVTTREEGVNQPLTPDNQPNPSGCEFQYDTPDDEPQSSAGQDGSAAATATRVHLVQSVRFPPHQSIAVEVTLESGRPRNASVLFVPDEALESLTGLSSDNTLLQPSGDGRSHILISNFTGYTQSLKEGEIVGYVEEVDIIDMQPEDSTCDSNCNAFVVRSLSDEYSDRDQQRRQKLGDVLTPPDLPPRERERLLNFLTTYHHVFSLEEGERGETDMVQMKIDTGDSYPKRQAPRRMPFAVREEVARQLSDMQKNGVISPSKSPWASPVVLVRKRDGTHRFCVDYRELNSVTKSDSFPLPRIDELLDQLGESKYFSTIDLASGFW